MKKKKVIFCIPTLTQPYPQTLASLKASIPLIVAAGWEEGFVAEVGCPYISAARSKMLRTALDGKADVIVFIDHDLSWDPGDLLKLIETDGDVVAGLYRFKEPEPHYMGVLLDAPDGKPLVRDDGAIKADKVPAGFLKITTSTVNRFIAAHPELCYGERHAPSVDLFNHGAYNNQWFGEDYAFSRRWRALGGEIWIVPDLNLNHHGSDAVFPGNFHEFLCRQPGGSKHRYE